MIAVSDRSFKEVFGTAGFVLERGSSDLRILGINVSLGGPVAQSSYQSEISGLCIIIFMVNLECLSFGITTGSVTVGCDGFSPEKCLWGGRVLGGSD